MSNIIQKSINGLHYFKILNTTQNVVSIHLILLSNYYLIIINK